MIFIRSLETSLRYLECLRPGEVTSPLDALYASEPLEVAEEVAGEFREPRGPFAALALAVHGVVAKLKPLRRPRTTAPTG